MAASGQELEEGREVGAQGFRHDPARVLEKPSQVRLDEGLLPEPDDGALLARAQAQRVVRFLEPCDVDRQSAQNRRPSLLFGEPDPRLEPDGPAIRGEEAVLELLLGPLAQRVRGRGHDPFAILGGNQPGPEVRRRK